jgi:hypothetical protein
MAKLGIFTGTTPNDGTGDSLLSGAVKINSNFTELYTTFGDGTNLSNGGLNITGVITATSSVRVASAVTITSGGINATTGFVTATEYDIAGTSITLNSGGLNHTGVVTAASIIATTLNLTGVTTSVSLNATNFRATGVTTLATGGTNPVVLIGNTVAYGSTTGMTLQVGTASSLQNAYVSGNVGVGSTIPTQPLDVIGDARITGTLRNASMVAYSVAFGM